MSMAVGTASLGEALFSALARHWAAVAIALLFLFATLPLAAPLLSMAGIRQAALLYEFFDYFCEQRPGRSFFLAGFQVAVCQRCLAIYLAMFFASLAYWRYRPALSWKCLLVSIAFSLPIMVDGFTQNLGYRESTWWLRVGTGSLYGVGWVYFFFPFVSRILDIPHCFFRRWKADLLALPDRGLRPDVEVASGA
jgi:uncharacterized membrane protein